MALDSTTPENASMEDYRAAARQLLERIDAGDIEGAQSVIDDLTHLRETELFRELGTLTRELHESIKAFHYDERLADITESEIPDARERLNYVITMTEQAAHRTLTMIEESTPVVQWVADEGERLAERWQAFRRRDLDVEQFRVLCRDLDDFLSHLQENGHKVTSQLNDALMAQDYQDLTGQIIRRVISLVEEVEGNLVKLVRISGQRMADDPQRAERRQSEANERMQRGEGPTIPGSDSEGTVSGQDEVDDLLSSLGF